MTGIPERVPGTAPVLKGKVLALDVGLARIGVAVCDPLQLAARPLTVIRRGNRRDDFARLAQLVDGEQVEGVVCGLPLNMDDSEGDQAKTTRKWAMRLAQALRALLARPVPIVFWDERLSTFAAQEILGTRRPSTEEDAVAAAVILQSYLDAQKRNQAAELGFIVLPPKDHP
jgi:putative holliday junction resolvase